MEARPLVIIALVIIGCVLPFSRSFLLIAITLSFQPWGKKLISFLWGCCGWHIECFHRVIKQVCNIERFYVRDEQAIRNHVFCALRAFCQLQTMQLKGIINNCYEISRQLFVPVIRQFILDNLTETTLAQPGHDTFVNA